MSAALQHPPVDVVIWRQRAAALSRLHRHGEALADVERILGEHPDDRGAQGQRAYLLACLGRFEEVPELVGNPTGAWVRACSAPN